MKQLPLLACDTGSTKLAKSTIGALNCATSLTQNRLNTAGQQDNRYRYWCSLSWGRDEYQRMTNREQQQVLLPYFDELDYLLGKFPCSSPAGIRRGPMGVCTG